jgi:peptide/nickel transport system substrate-binding protein
MTEDSQIRRPPRSELFTRREVLRMGTAGAGGLAVGGLLTACGGSQPSASGGKAVSGSVQRGGTISVGFIGNGTAETLNPTAPIIAADFARVDCIWDPFVRFLPDATLGYVLIDSLEPNSTADTWTLRLKDGISFHDGSPLTADDAMFTFRAYAQPSSTISLAADSVDLANMRKLDKLTVQLPLKSPNSDFPNFMQLMVCIKNGETSFAHPVGTGPFTYVSFTPGQQSILKRNPHYWQPGKPYADEMKFLSIPDQTARLDALLGGQIDAMESLDYAQAKEYAASGQIKVLSAPGANYVPIYMATNLAPFQDNRVRQAMRLIANRPQLIKEAQLGFGQVSNDLFGQGHPGYDTKLPQREQDIAQAKSLLKAAGQESLTVTLYSSTAAQGMLESATVFAAQAAAAGVNVKVQNVPASAYFGADYLKQNFAQSLWYAYDSVLSQMARSLAPNAPFNETHWNDPAWTTLYTQALATVDEAKRIELSDELQSILWNEGGYIYWGDFPVNDGMSPKLRGVVPNSGGVLGNGNYQAWWLAS